VQFLFLDRIRRNPLIFRDIPNSRHPRIGEAGKRQKKPESVKNMATKRRQKSPENHSQTEPPEAKAEVSETDRNSDRTPKGRILFDGKPRAFLLKSELVEFLGGWPKVVDRMLHATRNGKPWLEIVSNRSGASGAEVRVTADSVAQAIERLRRGEEPPLMPSEQKNSGIAPTPKRPGNTPDKMIAGLLRAADLLPSDVISATFYQNLKMITLKWANGDYQHVRRITKRGRNTRVITVCFDPSPKKISVLLPAREGDD